MANELVKYDNSLNLAQFTGLSAIGQDIFFALVSKMRDKDTDMVTLTYAQMRSLIHYDSTLSDTKFTAELRKTSKIVRSVDCSIPTEGGGFIDFNLFTTFAANVIDKTIAVRVNPDFAYMLNKFDHFTVFELSQFIHLQSRYTKTLYRKLKQFRSTGYYRVDIDEFRRIMNIPKSYVTRDITKRIISPSIADLSEDFQGLQCSPHHATKRGAPVDGYIFTFIADGQVPGQMSIGDYPGVVPPKKAPVHRNSKSDHAASPDHPKDNAGWDDLTRRIAVNK